MQLKIYYDYNLGEWGEKWMGLTHLADQKEDGLCWRNGLAPAPARFARAFLVGELAGRQEYWNTLTSLVGCLPLQVGSCAYW